MMHWNSEWKNSMLNEMAFQYWWPEGLSFYVGANSNVENKVYLELFNALFV